MLDIRIIGLKDYWRYCEAQNAPLPARNYTEIIGQVRADAVWGVFVDGAPVAIAGIAQYRECPHGIVWLSVLPSGFGAHALAIVRAARRVIGAHSRSCVAYVGTGNADGGRLARAIGLTATDRVVFGLREWRRDGGCIDGTEREKAGASGGCGAGVTAAGS